MLCFGNHYNRRSYEPSTTWESDLKSFAMHYVVCSTNCTHSFGSLCIHTNLLFCSTNATFDFDVYQMGVCACLSVCILSNELWMLYWLKIKSKTAFKQHSLLSLSKTKSDKIQAAQNQRSSFSFSYFEQMALCSHRFLFDSFLVPSRLFHLDCKSVKILTVNLCLTLNVDPTVLMMVDRSMNFASKHFSTNLFLLVRIVCG